MNTTETNEIRIVHRKAFFPTLKGALFYLNNFSWSIFTPFRAGKMKIGDT